MINEFIIVQDIKIGKKRVYNLTNLYLLYDNGTNPEYKKEYLYHNN